MTTTTIDNMRRVETPEGVEIALRLAGPIPRAWAWLIDLVIRALILVVLATPLSILGNFGNGIFLIVLFVIESFYPVLFEVLSKGSTPGKKVLGLRVLHDDGTPVGWTASIVRNLLRFADLMPMAFGAGLLVSLCNSENKRIGDLAAGTVVVYVEKPSAPAIPAGIAPLRPPFPLTLDEQHALLEFAERHQVWGPHRAAEIAAAAGPLVGPAQDRVATLLGMASFLLGRR
jgi:uncharacterized RDD family membrane protein YckC